MNLSLKLFVLLPFGFAAVALACSSEEPSSKSSINAANPEEDDDDIVHEGDDDDEEQGDDDDDKPAKKDAGTTKDAGKDSGGSQKAFTKADVQTLVNSRCTPCHIGNASGGMSLANDFTTQTVGVDSSELPSMKRIEPGHKEASYLFHKLSGTHLDQGGAGVRMPKGGPYLSSAEIANIGAYIDSL